MAAAEERPAHESQTSMQVIREHQLLVRSRRLRVRRKKSGRVEASGRIGSGVGHDQVFGGPGRGWSYLVCMIDCWAREVVGSNFSHRCRSEDALSDGRASGARTATEGSREAHVTLTTDNGTQSASSPF